jgi:hypothetical protein
MLDHTATRPDQCSVSVDDVAGDNPTGHTHRQVMCQPELVIRESTL